MARYTVILDACVMYPAPLRSYLMYLAQTGLFRARWTDQIHDEWIGSVLARRPDLSADKLNRTRVLMNRHVPDCLVEGYEPLVHGIELKDKDDRHVVAAAIKGQAEGIITFNLKDFPDEALQPLGLRAIHPDTFLCDMFELSPSTSLQSAQNHRRSLKNPPMTAEEYLEVLLRQKLPMLVSHLKQFTLCL